MLGDVGNGPSAAPAWDTGRRTELVELDPGAIELARNAAIAEAGTADHVGDLLFAVAEDDIAVTATFVARQAGYVGWHWSVTLAVLGAESTTVSEVVLLPGEGSLLAPAWIPWDQRIRPGDVGVGDLLPPIENDPRLVPAYLQSDDPAVEAVRTSWASAGCTCSAARGGWNSRIGCTTASSGRPARSRWPRRRSATQLRVLPAARRFAGPAGRRVRQRVSHRPTAGWSTPISAAERTPRR